MRIEVKTVQKMFQGECGKRMKHPEGKEKQGINLIYEYNYFFRKRMEKLFLGFYDRYSSVVKENMLSNGKRMKVSKSFPPFFSPCGDCVEDVRCTLSRLVVHVYDCWKKVRFCRGGKGGCLSSNSLSVPCEGIPLRTARLLQ